MSTGHIAALTAQDEVDLQIVGKLVVAIL